VPNITKIYYEKLWVESEMRENINMDVQRLDLTEDGLLWFLCQERTTSEGLVGFKIYIDPTEFAISGKADEQLLEIVKLKADGLVRKHGFLGLQDTKRECRL